MASKYFMDSDVILDYFLKRTPFNVPAREIFQLAYNDKIIVLTSSLAISNIHYISKKKVGKLESLILIKDFIKVCKILAVSGQEIQMAIKSDFSDFKLFKISQPIRIPKLRIITRKIADYKKAALPIYTPEAFLYLFR